MVCLASLPPFTSNPLAVAMASPDTCRDHCHPYLLQPSMPVYLRETVWASLKYDQEHSNGYFLLYQFQALCH